MKLLPTVVKKLGSDCNSGQLTFRRTTKSHRKWTLTLIFDVGLCLTFPLTKLNSARSAALEKQLALDNKMTQIDWDCPVCKQPNSASDSACISCNCAFDAKPNEILQQKAAYDLSEAENVRQAAIKASDSNVEVPLIPSTKYMGIFPSAPTVQVSLIIFACCYFVVLIVAIPLALKFKPNILSSIASGAIVTAAISVVNYWKRSNMLISLRATKWTLILGSLVIILFADMIASILSIKMNNLQYFTSIIVQKIGQVFLLWMAYGTNAFTGVKKRPSTLKELS